MSGDRRFLFPLLIIGVVCGTAVWTLAILGLLELLKDTPLWFEAALTQPLDLQAPAG